MIDNIVLSIRFNVTGKWKFWDVMVDAVNCYKYLGVTFTTTLSFNLSFKERAFVTKYYIVKPKIIFQFQLKKKKK